MSDFFTNLEFELREAADRPPRRGPDWGAALRGGGGAVAVAAVVALALIPLFLIIGSDDGERPPADTPERSGDAPVRTPSPALVPTPAAPVGTVIPKGEGMPPRENDSTVVARGEAYGAGPWQMEVYRSNRLANPETGEEYQPAGLRCISLFLLDPPKNSGAGGGSCGEMRRTPDFSRQQERIPGTVGSRPKVLLVYGRVPEEAESVQVTIGDVRMGAHPFEGPPGVRGDFYLTTIPPEPGRINWIDADGNPGSRGIELLPP